MKIRTSLALLLLLLWSLPVAAEVYRWVDDRGTVNYTDSLGNIPRKYRHKATIVDESSGQPEIREVAEEPKKMEAPPAGQEKPPAAKEGTEQKKRVYGDKDEDAWRREFARLRSDLRQTQDSIDERRKRLGETEKLSRSQYLALQYDIGNLEKRLETLRGRLGALEESANKAGVPQEIRQ